MGTPCNRRWTDRHTRWGYQADSAARGGRSGFPVGQGWQGATVRHSHRHRGCLREAPRADGGLAITQVSDTGRTGVRSGIDSRRESLVGRGIDLGHGSLGFMLENWTGRGWTALGSEVRFASQWFEVRRDDALRPDGSRGVYDRVVAPPAVTVLA